MVVVTWCVKGETETFVWSGVVVTVRKGRRLARVNYEGHGVFPFPPNVTRYTVRKVVVQNPLVSQINLRLNRCTVGDFLVHRFLDKQGLVQSWTGQVVAKDGHQLRIRYPQSQVLLPFPAPATARIKTVAFWFVKPTVASSKIGRPSVDPLLPRSDGAIEVSPASGTTSKQKSVSKEQKKLNLASWNCRTCNSHWRIAELSIYLSVHIIHIMLLQETRWNDQTLINIPGYTVHTINAVKGICGVAILVKNEVEITKVVLHPTLNIIELTTPWREGELVILACYAPNAAKEEVIRTKWWSELSELHTRIQQRNTKHPTPILILGDLNSELGKDKKGFLETFLDVNQFVFMNETFTKPLHKKLTFYGTHKRTAILDACLIAKRWRSTVTDVYASKPPFPSDHRVLHVSIRFKISYKTTINKKPPTKPFARWKLLHNDAIAREFSSSVLSTLSRCVCHGLQWLNAIAAISYLANSTDGLSLDPASIPVPAPTLQPLPSTYSDFALASRIASSMLVERSPQPLSPPVPTGLQWLCCTVDFFGPRPPHPDPFQPTYCASIIRAFSVLHPVVPDPVIPYERERSIFRRLYDYRRLERSYTIEEYAQVKGLIRDFASLEPREAWASISKVVRTDPTRSSPTKSTPDEIAAYFRAINGTDQSSLEPPIYSSRLPRSIVLDGPFSMIEVREAISKLNSFKAVGEDGVPAEILKLPAVEELLLQYANDYWTGTVPSEVLLTRLSLVPKKGDLSVVQNYRGIAITSVFLKLLNLLLLHRLRVLDPHMRYNQNGFRPLRGTGEQGLAMKILADAIRDGLDASVSFVDFSKAFDSVTFAGVRAALVAFKVPEQMITVIFQCYHSHFQTIPSVGATWEVKTGVLQGDTLAPFLFVLLLDCILHDSLDPTLGLHLDTSTPITSRPRSARLRAQFAPHTLTDLDYADDLALITLKSSANAQLQLRNLELGAAAVNLKLNVGKNKTEVIAPTLQQSTPISLSDGRSISFTDKYIYLGQQPMDPAADFRRRKGLTWVAIHKFDGLWKNPAASDDVKRSLCQTFAISVLLHGSHLWPATAEFNRTIDSAYFKMLRYCCWKPGRLPLDHFAVFDGGRIPQLSTLVLQLRIRTLGHGIRHDQCLRQLIAGDWLPPVRRYNESTQIVGELKSTSHRPRSTIQQLERDTGLPRADWIDHAQRRDHWRDIGHHACYTNEERYWHAYGNARRHRWRYLPRLQRRIDLNLNETTASLLMPPIHSYSLQPFFHPKHTNTYHHACHNPLFQRPRTPRTPTPVPRVTPRRIRQRWDWTPAAQPSSLSATPSRVRRRPFVDDPPKTPDQPPLS